MKNKLSKTEFSIALKRGHGRARMHVDRHGLQGVREIILNACLKDPNYDTQCESSKAEWLFEMFKSSGDLQKFTLAILDALQTETDLNDLSYLCDFAYQIAKNGDGNAGRALREIVMNQPLPDPKWPYGTHQLVSQYGVDAVVALAKKFGALLIENKSESSMWLGDFEDDIPSAKRKLARLSKTHPDIKAFLNNQKEQKKRFANKTKTKSKSDKPEIELSCEEFVAHFYTKVSKEAYNFELKLLDRRLARTAYDEDLIALLERLNGEKDETTTVRVLRVFEVAWLPGLPPFLWKLVESKNMSIRNATIAAMAKIHDDRLGELARSKLQSKNFKAKDAEFIRLMIENFTSQDDQLILNALNQTSLSDDIAHGVGFAIRDIYRANGKLVNPDLLLWDYECNPCTECRCSTVRLLMDLKGMTPEIAEECQYDSNEEIRELFQKAAEIS